LRASVCALDVCTQALSRPAIARRPVSRRRQNHSFIKIIRSVALRETSAHRRRRASDQLQRSSDMTRTIPNTFTAPALPPIVITASEAHRLSALADSSMAVFPRVAQFLARETDRARVVADDSELPDVVRMGARVRYRDDETGDVREVVLVYPHEADIALRRISVLTPVGAALIGLSVGQTIDFQTPSHQTRAVTILAVKQQS
jgi:regulator of nucleoside diphosphate kinase